MLKKHVHSVQEQKAEQHLLRMDKSHLVEGQLHQKLDHFNGRITDTFPQVQKYIV